MCVCVLLLSLLLLSLLLLSVWCDDSNWQRWQVTWVVDILEWLDNTEGSLAFAELGTLIPKSGGEYIYYLEAFGPLHRFWGPLLPFLHAWISVNLLRTASTAIAALSFAEYLTIPLMNSVGLCDPVTNHYILTRLTATLCICKSHFCCCCCCYCCCLVLFFF